MKVLINRPTFLRGQPLVPGAKIEVSEAEARELISAGKAVPFREEVETAELPRAAVEVADAPQPKAVEPEAEAEARPKRGKKKASE